MFSLLMSIDLAADMRLVTEGLWHQACKIMYLYPLPSAFKDMI